MNIRVETTDKIYEIQFPQTELRFWAYGKVEINDNPDKMLYIFRIEGEDPYLLSHMFGEVREGSEYGMLCVYNFGNFGWNREDCAIFLVNDNGDIYTQL